MPNNKTYLSDDRTPPQSQIGASLESLAHTIHERRNAGDESYTHRLLTGDIDTLLKRLMRLRLRQRTLYTTRATTHR